VLNKKKKAIVSLQSQTRSYSRENITENQDKVLATFINFTQTDEAEGFVENYHDND
jgi:hypothetical protein